MHPALQLHYLYNLINSKLLTAVLNCVGKYQRTIEVHVNGISHGK